MRTKQFLRELFLFLHYHALQTDLFVSKDRSIKFGATMTNVISEHDQNCSIVLAQTYYALISDFLEILLLLVIISFLICY